MDEKQFQVARRRPGLVPIVGLLSFVCACAGTTRSDGGPTTSATSTGASSGSSTGSASTSNASASTSAAASSATSTPASSSSMGGSSTSSGSTTGSSSSGAGGTSLACVANVLNGVPCPAGQTCNDTGTACIGNFGGSCSTDADCPCGCGCAAAPANSCTNCLTNLGPYQLGLPGQSSCTADSDCGPACLGFACVGGGNGQAVCFGSGLLLSPPSEAMLCAASLCTDAGVACASIPCTADGGECTSACGSEWSCFVATSLDGNAESGHCVEPYPDAGTPPNDGGFMGTFAGSPAVFALYVDAGLFAEGTGGGPQELLPGPDAGTFTAFGLMGGCNPVFEIVQPGFAVASPGAVCLLENLGGFDVGYLTFGFAVLVGNQLTVETLWTTEPGGQEATTVWLYSSTTRQ